MTFDPKVGNKSLCGCVLGSDVEAVLGVITRVFRQELKTSSCDYLTLFLV